MSQAHFRTHRESPYFAELRRPGQGAIARLASAARAKIGFGGRGLSADGAGCQLMEAGTSVGRRFMGSSKSSNALDS